MNQSTDLQLLLSESSTESGVITQTRKVKKKRVLPQWMVLGVALISPNKKKNCDIREFGVKIDFGTQESNLETLEKVEICTDIDRLTQEKLKPNPLKIKQNTIKDYLGTPTGKSDSQNDMKTQLKRTTVSKEKKGRGDSKKKQNLKISKKKNNVNDIMNYFLPLRDKIENLPPDKHLKSSENEQKEQLWVKNKNLNVMKSPNLYNYKCALEEELLLSDTESQTKPNSDQSIKK